LENKINKYAVFSQLAMDFAHRVYSACKRIPRGKVSTYKEIAKALGSRAYRAVGQALRHNPYAPIVPCHRVVSSDGTIGGFAGESKGNSIKRKIALLEKEGVRFSGRRIRDFARVLHRF
jgi:methylated-DNA-[protein]-cysteine S-methyltransferase